MDVVAADPWSARMLVADLFRTERLFLVGESAHLNPPWGGHGFNTCVGDAVNIGWKIAAVEHGWAAPALLASYEPERRPVVQSTVGSAASNMATLAGDLADQAASMQQLKHSEFYSLGLVLGYTYGHSPVVDGTPRQAPATDVSTYVPSTEPGCRLPHMWLGDGPSLYDHLGGGLTLISPGRGTPRRFPSFSGVLPVRAFR